MEEKKKTAFAAGVYDCYSARTMKHAGYDMLVVTGGAVAGCEGNAFVTLEDACWCVSRMTILENDIPVYVDVRNGYSESEAYMERVAARLKACGAAGLILDDSTVCPESENGIVSECGWKKRVFEAVKAAGDMPVVALACGAGSVEDAIARCRIALDAGAKMVGVRTFHSEENVKKFADAIQADKVWFEDCKPTDVVLTKESLEAAGFTMVYHDFAEEAAKWGMEIFGNKTMEDKHTVFHDDHDFDGLIPGTSLTVLYNFTQKWIPQEKEYMDLGTAITAPDTVKIGGQTNA